MNTCIINQPAGLGDIFFSMKIAKYMVDLGYEVIWPVIPNFLYLKEYIIEKNINFISTSDILQNLLFGKKLVREIYFNIVIIIGR